MVDDWRHLNVKISIDLERMVVLWVEVGEYPQTRIGAVLDNKTDEFLECLKCQSCRIAWFQLKTNNPPSSREGSEWADWITTGESIGLISPGFKIGRGKKTNLGRK